MGDGDSVRKNGPMVLLVAALAFLGVRSFTPDSASPFKTHAENSAQSSARQEQDGNVIVANRSTNNTKRFWQPLVEHRDSKVDDDLNKEITDSQSKIDLNDARCLIACVPDPIKSMSAYRFDGLIDAIQRATETQEFVLDRYFYPWPRRMKHAGVELAFREIGQILKYPPLRDDPEHQPGVLLLRNNNRKGPCRLLLVFLVGETATAGLDKKAFAACLPFVKKSGGYRDSKTILVLGPYFSGSQLSLEQSIRAWPRQEEEEKPTFRVISGNATSIVKKHLCGCDLATVKFNATVVPDINVVEALQDYLKLRKRSEKGFEYEDNFAILHEGNTAVGQSVSQDADRKKDSPKRPTYFPFPLRISEMRSAYNKTTNNTQETKLRLPSFGNKLPMPADDGNSPRDVEPALNPPWTAVATERLLNQMLETISREHFRYVFIVATDMRDQLFLAQLVRQHCPESRVVLTNSDLLLGHPDVSADLRGSIVGCSYPLYSSNQRWSFPFGGADRRLFFLGLGEQGYYNATIALLNKEDSRNLVEYGPPFPGPSSERRPPVWISIIGQGGLYPLKAVPILKDEKFRDYVHLAPESSGAQNRKAEFAPSYLGSWIAAVLGMGLLFFYVGLAYVSVVRKQASWWQKWRWQKKIGVTSWKMSKLFLPRTGYRCSQRRFVFICLAAVFLVYWYLTFVWFIPVVYWLLGGENYPVQMPWWNTFASLILVALPLVLIFLVWGRRGIVCLLIFFLFVVLINAPICDDEFSNAWRTGENLLFFERATHLTSGVTPVVPIIMLGMAFFCWAYFQLQRLFLLNEHGVKNPFPSKKSLLLFREVNKHDKDIDELLKSPWKKVVRPGSAWIAGVVLFFIFCRLSIHFAPPIDPSTKGIFLGGLLWLALIVLSVLIVHGWLHLRKVWENVRKLLRAIALLPLEEAFANIPSVVTNMFGPNLTSERPGRQGHLNHQREQHRLLMKEYADYLAKTKHPVALRRKAMMPCPENDKKASEHLTNCARVCLRLLHYIWDDPRLTKRFLKKPPDETVEKASSVVIAKKVHTELQGNSADTTIEEKIEPEDADDTDKAVRKWLARAQGFVALEVTYYLSQFFVQLRDMALFLSIAPLLMLFAVTSYPFQPQRLWMWLAVSLVGLVTLSVIWLAIQVERDELVSRIVKTTPNQINFHWSFLSHLALYAVPLLGILAAMSSGMSDLVHSLVDPLLQALR